MHRTIKLALMLMHDGSIASLEEMFDPDRLKDTHEPGG